MTTNYKRKEYPFWDWRTRQCRSAPEYNPSIRLWVVRSHNPMDELMSGLDEIGGICDDFGNLDLKSRYDYLRSRK